jgi:hypothetical protein
MRMRLTEELWREGNMYVAYCPELDVPSCGETGAVRYWPELARWL